MNKIRKGWKHRKIELDGKLVTVQVDSNGSFGKYCKVQKKFLPVEDFYIVRTRSGSDKWCLSTYSKSANATKTREYRQADRLSHLISGAKNRSRINNLEFDLDKTKLTLPDVCPVLGIPLNHDYGPRTFDRSTIDRVDPSKGYTMDNVVICSWRANRLKNNATYEELELLYKFVRDFYLAN